jgi:protein-tyrosine-phosphatase
MTDRTRNVLFLCTGNSARSIMAEALLTHRSRGRFRGFSAGSHPTGKVNSHAIGLLRGMGLSTQGLRSKTWDEFAKKGAPKMDFVITVCDSAKGEAGPVWPGKPPTAHWGVEDPAAVVGNEDTRDRAFTKVASAIQQRIDRFLNLPFDQLDAMTIKERIDAIGCDP